MTKTITTLEIAQILMVAPQTISQIAKRNEDFPEIIGKLPTFGAKGRPVNLYDRPAMMQWLFKNRSEHLGKAKKNQNPAESDGILTSLQVADLLGIECHKLAYFIKKQLDFPKANYSRGRKNHYNKAQIEKWVADFKKMNPSWADDDDGIRYTTPSNREKFTAPKTMHFAFISGQYRPRN